MSSSSAPAGASITAGGTSALASQLQARATTGETYTVTPAPDGSDVIRLVIASTSPDTTPPAATAGLTACGGGVYAGADTSWAGTMRWSSSTTDSAWSAGAPGMCPGLLHAQLAGAGGVS